MRYVDVTWIEITGWQDERLQWNKVLYAICDALGKICYIGKADKDTLYQRLKDPDKEKLGLRTFYVYCGLVKSLGTFNVSSDLLSDAEALLIQREQPRGNKVQPLISDEISLKCDGFWKGKTSVYEYKTLRRIVPRVTTQNPTPVKRAVLPRLESKPSQSTRILSKPLPEPSDDLLGRRLREAFAGYPPAPPDWFLELMRKK